MGFLGKRPDLQTFHQTLIRLGVLHSQEAPRLEPGAVKDGGLDFAILELSVPDFMSFHLIKLLKDPSHDKLLMDMDVRQPATYPFEAVNSSTLEWKNALRLQLGIKPTALNR